jgi:hypothetical protein
VFFYPYDFKFVKLLCHGVLNLKVLSLIKPLLGYRGFKHRYGPALKDKKFCNVYDIRALCFTQWLSKHDCPVRVTFPKALRIKLMTCKITRSKRLDAQA